MMQRSCLLLSFILITSLAYSQTMTIHLKSGKKVDYNTRDIDKVTYSFGGKPVEGPFRKGLIAYYPFNGSTADESSNGNDAMNIGVQLATDRFGNQNASVYFFGEKNYLTIRNNASFNNLKELTVAAWIRSSGKEWGVILSKGDNQKYQYALVMNMGSAMIVAWTYSGENHLRAEGFVADGNWHLVTGVIKDGVSASLYVDGVLKQTDSSPKSQWLKTGNADLKIGCRLNNGREDGFFKGYVDDISFYNRALTADEIKALYRESGWK